MKKTSTVEEIDRHIDGIEGHTKVDFGNFEINGVIERNECGYWLTEDNGNETELHIGGLDLRNGKLFYDFKVGEKSAIAAEEAEPFVDCK